MTRIRDCAHSMASMWVILRTPALLAPYGAEETRQTARLACSKTRLGHVERTLLGLSTALEAVKTMEPLAPSLMSVLAATLV